MPGFSPHISSRLPHRLAAIFLLAMLIEVAGCGHFRHAASVDYVYVTVKRMYLRDRVAVVANRVAEVTNGERLKVLEPGRRFLRVRTPQGAVGWIEAHAVIDQEEFNKFAALAKQHANQPPVATAILYNELYMHLEPGRKTQRFYLLPPNSKVFMLDRASIPRAVPGSVLGLPAAKPKPVRVTRSGKASPHGFESRFLPAVPMEDWWLIRDKTGQTGWMLSRDLAVDVPNDVAQYAENERMVGAYILRTVDDPDSGKPNGKVPEYVTVLTPYKEGLPYDFDQVRVFTWDTRRHRYGTSFRQRDVVGFFPVKVSAGQVNSVTGPEPTFSFQIAAANDVGIDPQTGRARAAHLETLTYRLEGNLVRRVLPLGAKPAATETHAERHHEERRARHRKRRHRR